MTKQSIHGAVISGETRLPLARLRVEAWDKDLIFDDLLGSDETDDRGEFTIEFDARYFRELVDRHADVYFKVLDGQRVLADTRKQVLWNVRQPGVRILIPVWQAAVPPGPGTALEVSGRVTTDAARPAADLIIEAWDQSLGSEKLVATGATDARGRYSLHYDTSSLTGKLLADLQIRVLDPRRQRVEIARSRVYFQADRSAVIDVVVPAAEATRASEYERLLGDVGPLLGTTALAALDAPGVAYVAQRSGWDARMVAMAARAAQLSGETGIPAPHYFALLRSGLGGDAQAVHRLSDAAVARNLAVAAERGIIPSLATDDTVRRYREAGAAAMATLAPRAAVSDLGTMLDLTLDAAGKPRFLAAYRASAGDPAALWSALATAGFDAATITRLQTDGKLGQLTRQNAPLIQRLYATQRVNTIEDLAGAGLYKAAAWLELIGDDAPAGVTREAYAAGLAAQVNLAQPNLVTAEMIRSGELAIERANADGHGEVAAFLRSGHGTKTLGRQPIKTWDGYGEMSAAGQNGARLVERLFQLSPSNESMVALDQLGLHSAFAIVRKPLDAFMGDYGGTFPSVYEAQLVYDKAQDVHAAALNVATMYLSYRASPNLYAITGNLAKQTPDYSDVPGAPTLEELFQNLDYCACDHCRSVLSPAAYFVELLQFIDVATVPAGTRNPADVLRERRPDLEHLLLSCENTNVVLPYIDLVNEVLEYYVVEGDLVDFTGHDMASDSVSADLLADPQYVIAAAYDTTNAQVFPHALPFDMPLAALRLLVQAWDSSLPAALRLLGTPAVARRESLRLSPAELSILTSTAYRPLPAYFGEPDGATITQLNAAIANGKTFARRTAVTYEELVELLRTTFINPGAPLVALLEATTVPLAQLQAWYTNVLDDAGLQALLPAGLDAAAYGGDVLAWLTANRALIMGLVTLTDVTAEPAECNFALLELRLALPDNAANRLTAFEYQKLHRFIRLWKKLGWPITLIDDVLISFLGMPAAALNAANLDAAMTTVVASLGNLAWLMERQSISVKKLPDWLALWDTSLDVAAREERLGALLRFGVTDLRGLAELTGVDPLAADLHSDSPSLLRFLDAWAALKSARLKVVDLDYLLRHRDATGKLVPAESALLRDLAGLRAALTAVDVDLTAPAAGADLGFARAKMALVYDPTVVDWFLGLISDGRSYLVPFATVEEGLPAKLTDVEPRLSFDPFARQLGCTGVLPEATRVALSAAADTLVIGDFSTIIAGDVAGYIADFKVAIQALVDAGAADLAELAADYPELQVIYTAVAAVADPGARVKALVDAIVPALRGQLQLTALRTTLTAQLKLPADVVDTLTASAAVMHAHGNAAAGIAEDLRGLGATPALDANGAHALYLEPAATDDHNLYVAAPPGTTVTLVLAGATVIPATAVGAAGEVGAAAAIKLTAGALTAATVTLAGLPAGRTAELRWRTKAAAKAAVPATRRYAAARVTAARASLLRLQKAALLLPTLPLTARELRHLAALDTATAGFLDALDIDGTIGPAALHAQWTRVAWLAWFTGLKRAEPDTDTWISLLEQPGLTTQSGALVLAGAAGWLESDLTAALTHFGLVLADLDELSTFRRVKDAVDLITTTQQPGAELVTWVTGAPTAATITAIKDSLKARQDDASWRATLQSVSDALRNQRRDALVAYILHHAPPTADIDTSNKLYEHFLIDVEMDACMQTSRIRMALSTVQLFIGRCLMSLETTVSASVIRADHWAWMKRYRVWEANRKVFLYPENWLEPELRDNKSPFFKELESELLKADITDELAEDAYLAYLKKLDEISRLDIVASYLQESEAGNPDDDILHVFGRTAGTTRKYYYRRYEYGYWTPWEKVTLEITGDLLAPVIWKKQLYLFWITAHVKPEGAGDKKLVTMGEESWAKNAKVSAELTLAWGEYFRGKWTSPKSTPLAEPVRFQHLDVYDARGMLVSWRTFRPSPDVSERLLLSLYYIPGSAQADITFTSKNAPPKIDRSSMLVPDVVAVHNDMMIHQANNTGYDHDELVDATESVFTVRVEQPPGATTSSVDEKLLTKTAKLLAGFRARPLWHPVENQWEAPMFYSDDHSVFFVAPDERITYHFEDTYFWVDDPGLWIPPEYVEVIPEWEIPHPGDPIEDPLGPLINPVRDVVRNPNYTHMINSNQTFDYAGEQFDAGGLVGPVGMEKEVVR